MTNSDQFKWESIVRRLILAVSLLCSIAPFVLYLLFSIGKFNVGMEAEADIFTHTITDEINRNPEYWQYEDIRFSSILRHRQPAGGYQEYRELFDINNTLVAENSDSLQPPLISVQAHVYEAGIPVGVLKITRSIRSILNMSVIVLLISSICGGIVYFIMHVFPLKVMRAAFAALHKEKEQATVTLRSIGDAVITTDTSLSILSLNPAAANLAGKQPDRVVGKLFYDCFRIAHPETLETAENCLENCLNSGVRACHLRKQAILVRRTDEQQFQVEITVSPLHDEKTELLGLAIIFHDVSETRALEKQLKEKMLELAVSVKFAGVGIAFVRDGILQEINTIAAEIIGLPMASLIGQPAADMLINFMGYKDSIDEIYQHLSKGKIFDTEYEVVRPDGKRMWLRLIGQGVDPSNIGEGGSVWIVQDISELKHYQEKLQSAKFHAEEASRFKTEFLAHVSHEIRNPLGGILGISRLVLETDLTDIQRKYLAIVENSTDTLLLLINNLLDLSKIEAGMMELDAKDFKVQAVFDYVKNVVALRVKEKGLSLNMSVSEDVPRNLIGDELRLGQILLNLVGNAVKFTSAGKISVNCEKVSQTKTDVKLRFSVTDTGCGINDDAMSKIFDTFVQASSSVARTHGGSGLGLSICKKLTKLMGGDLGVESKPGEGSIFFFTGLFSLPNLPKDASEESDELGESSVAREEAEQRETLQLQSLRILLVEDIPFNQTIARLILEGSSRSFHVVANGKEALATLAKHDFDLILMDVQMPEMDGLTATRLIRRCEMNKNPLAREDNKLMRAISSKIYGKHIPIVGLTGNATGNDKLECIAAGMDTCISKPYVRQELLDVVDDVLKGII